MNSSQELNSDAMQWAYDHATDSGALASGVATVPCSPHCLASNGGNDNLVNLGDSSLSHAGFDYDAEMNLRSFNPRRDHSNGPSLYVPTSLGVPGSVTNDNASAVGQKIGAYELDYGQFLLLNNTRFKRSENFGPVYAMRSTTRKPRQVRALDSWS
jgi:hypothetical protein